MQFAQHLWLYAGIAICAASVWGLYSFNRARAQALELFASRQLLPGLTRSVSHGSRRVKMILLVVALGCICIALARPQAGFSWVETKRKGIDFLVAIDTSKSMDATDVSPSRLERCKLGITDFLSRLDGDRVGLIPFSGNAFLMCPLTLDYSAVAQSLMALDTGIIPKGGTDISSAIREAEAAFAGSSNNKILVLITDGENLAGDAVQAAREAAGRGMIIYTIGVGTPGGELIPLQGRPGFVKDEQGQLVKSRLDEGMLQKIAAVAGGTYEPFGISGEGLEAVYSKKLNLLPKKEVQGRMEKVPIERFAWPLLAALILLTLEFLISERAYFRRKTPAVKTAGRRQPIGRPARSAAAATALLFFLIAGYGGTADASPQSAEQAYKKGNYDAAAEQYAAAAKKEPGNEKLQFNLGAAHYKNGKFSEAGGAFQDALQTQDLTLQHQAYYNLGNTLYRQGQQSETASPQQTMQAWQQSLQAYQAALKLDPADKDATFNYALVKKKLDELQKEQNSRQQNQTCNSGNTNGDSDNKPGSQEQNQNAQNKDNSGSQDQQAGANKPDQKPNEQSGSTAGTNGQDKKNDRQKDSAQNPTDSTPQLATGQQDNSATGSRSQERTPGQMSQEEAEQLLDAMKSGESAVPYMQKSEQSRDLDEAGRDW